MILSLLVTSSLGFFREKGIEEFQPLLATCHAVRAKAYFKLKDSERALREIKTRIAGEVQVVAGEEPEAIPAGNQAAGWIASMRMIRQR